MCQITSSQYFYKQSCDLGWIRDFRKVILVNIFTSDRVFNKIIMIMHAN